MRPDPHSTLSLNDMRTLLRIARQLNTPTGNAIELSILTLRRLHEVLALDLSMIEWGDGVCHLPRGSLKSSRDWTRFILSNAALSSIHRIAGSAAGAGQAVTAGRGKPLEARALRLDRLQTQIAKKWPKGPSPTWSFHAIRRSGATILHDLHRHPATALEAALGLARTRPRMIETFTIQALHLQAKAALNCWAELLLKE